MNRRSFLLTAASLTALPADFLCNSDTEAIARSIDDAGDFADGLMHRQTSSSASPWYAVMRRCGQINYNNERDPLTMDAEAWGDYWASLKVDAVLLNGGGIVAFYPTQVPHHHRSEFLGSRDLFGEMVAAMKRRGIRAVARMDCKDQPHYGATRGILIRVSLDCADDLFMVKALAVRAGYRPAKLPDFGASLPIESLHTTMLHTSPPARRLRWRKNLQAWSRWALVGGRTQPSELLCGGNVVPQRSEELW